jgi:glycosyltransferase involved in cell wall biosynthesis
MNGSGITVVVPVYNGARFLAEALDSVLAQSLTPAEIVAIDDGSTDESPSILAAYPQVRVLRQENAGCARARNRGVAEARFHFVAFLDQDDVWHRERLEQEQNAFAEDAGLGFVISAQENFLTPGMTALPGWIDPRSMGRPQHGFGTNSLTLKRATFEQVGPFDPAKTPRDDSDWFLRALDGGVAYRHLPGVLVRRRIHDSNLTGVFRGTPHDTALMARMLHASLQRRRKAEKSA